MTDERYIDMAIEISGNATKMCDFDKCSKLFYTSEKLAVINEGLLRYLAFEEKRQVAKNVFQTLKRFDDVWITCDVTPNCFIHNQSK